jgi:asparagine synthetase B (glutamine-hydrolysing)
MCGILVSSKNISMPINNLLVNRGPDHTNLIKNSGLNFVHTLLSMTGEFTVQPVIKNNVVFLLNGEIYNFNKTSDYPSDIYFIIDLYFKYGDDFVKHLDGEYSIVIVDNNKSEAIFTTDTFGIKPLFYAIENEDIGISSYEEPLIELGFKQTIKVEPSTIKKINLINKKVVFSRKYFEFNLRQHKNNYSSWIESFLNAITKRFENTDKKIILPLSSGFDSGAIACAFNMLNIPSTFYSFYNYEHVKVINKRLKKVNKENKIYKKNSLSLEERNFSIELLKKNCSLFNYGPTGNKKDAVFNGIDDPGAHGLAFLLDQVKREDSEIKILASGQGADEIMSNISSYNFGKPNPKIFPENLEDVFPWENFYFGTQSSYLSKEESISGGFGIEGRYPFLDREVVQEYLWLLPKLKNEEFKSPIVNFLKKNKYPYRKSNTLFHKNVSVKSGFNA